MKPQRKRAEGQGIRQIAVVGKLFFVAVSQTTCAGAGNKCPMKRLAFPDIDQDLLNDSLDSYVRAFGMNDSLDSYVRAFGMKESFNLYNYKAMAPQHAEHARSMFKLHKLLKALLAASPSGQIKYRHLKAGVVHIQQTFGEEVLSAHHTTKDSNLLAGSIADCLTVLLNHWRRVAGTDSNFEKFLTKLDDSQAEIMRALRDGAEPASSSKGGRQLAPHVSAITEDSEGFPELSSACPKNTKKRQLEPKISQVTVDSQGFPTMSVTTPSKKKKDSLASEAAAASPPPAVVIHVPSLSIGGGKDQAYIQHQPEGPGTSKRLVVSIHRTMAARTTKGHRWLIEQLLPLCKGKNGKPVFKKTVVEARDKLVAKHLKK